jgi:septum formation protein
MVQPIDSAPCGLILASASPRRSELLQRMGLRFEICPSGIEEDDSGSKGPELLVMNNAQLKASDVAQQHPHAITLGADTTVVLDNTIFSKPQDLTEAASMLTALSGRWHRVMTAVALVWPQGEFYESFISYSSVQFKPLNRSLIEAYFQSVNPLDKAGAYGIQTGREMIIESVKGSIENVMGLPVQILAEKFVSNGFVFDS